MFKRLHIKVRSDGSLVLFAFEKQLHLLTFAVSSNVGEIAWKFIPEGAEPASSTGAMFWSQPAPISLIDAMEGQETVQWDLPETDHLLPALQSITYAEVPCGYVADGAAMPLIRGAAYHVVFIAEEGHGGTAFVL